MNSGVSDDDEEEAMMFTGSPISSLRAFAFEKEEPPGSYQRGQDEFWGANSETHQDPNPSSMNETCTQIPAVNMQPKQTVLHGAVIDDDHDDDVSIDSISILSEDSDPPRILTHKLLLTDGAEEEFFQSLYDILTHGFRLWKEKHQGKVLKFEDYDECVVDFETFYDEWVTFGRKPDGTGFWTGHVKIGHGMEVVKLKIRGAIILGVSLGGIRDLGGDYGAGLYAGEDGNMYYAPIDTWVDQDDDTRMLIVPVRGPYAISALGGRNVLNPSLPTKFPDK